MIKFEALHGLTKLVVPFIQRDEKGQIVRDQTISFNDGVLAKDFFQPAYLIPTDKDVIEYLRACGSNESNGGNSFKEVKAEEDKKPAAAPKAKALAPVSEPSPSITETEQMEDEEEIEEEDPSSETSSIGEAASNVYPDVTTAQEAKVILQKLFPELTARDVSNKAKVFEVAEAKGISFPSLNP